MTENGILAQIESLRERHKEFRLESAEDRRELWKTVYKHGELISAQNQSNKDIRQDIVELKGSFRSVQVALWGVVVALLGATGTVIVALL